MGSVSTWEEQPYGRRLLPTLVDKISIQDPTRECFQIPRSSSIADGWKVITWKDMANAVNRAAHRMVELCGKPEPGSFPTIAYIGPNDIRYVVTILASIKAGYQVGPGPVERSGTLVSRVANMLLGFVHLAKKLKRRPAQPV